MSAGSDLVPTPAEFVIEVREGAVSLGGRPVLRGINLSIRPGEVVAVLGANGSGKSTLIRTMMGLVPLTRGDVLLYGESLSRFHDWHRIGFVPQRASAAGGVPASVWEVVSSGRLARRPLLRPMRKSDRAAVANAIDAVGLGAKARESVSTLSGGQQQRVLIARALAGEPDMFVLDEPTAGVDHESQQAFADALADLVGRGATIVLVTHELGPIAPLIARTVVMRDGRLVYDGKPVLADSPESIGHSSDGHHHPALQQPASDHLPVIASPLDQSRLRRGRR